ncbi:CRISPR-associated protein, Cas1 family [Granulicella rosea]|uniref:CRISPR-associated endonuclease Cas1 n=1 Tax=Granulicella rosea TaxID=474952 RepID=A0A239K5T8_9BACT|nr:type I-C CRISPR-associated endonuclease Cas1c [Granulicella rosea]SNT13361.1 CRISPR-associated protein, Cas1 family [Granulicella rosea]
MRKLLNTLHVTTQGAYLHRDGETISVKIGEEVRLRLPIHTVESVLCYGRVTCSPFVLGLCCERGVGVSMLTEQGRFMARVSGPVSGNVLLRRRQYRAADEPVSALPIVIAMVVAKIANSRLVLLRGAREAADEERKRLLRTKAHHLSQMGLAASRSATIDEARGYEGIAAQDYFSVFNELIAEREKAFSFGGRSRRPPLDRVNAMLSFLYALLRQDVVSALESVGLDPAVGFLHTDRPGRASLALDLMEEFRPHLADRLVLKMINRRQVEASGFREVDGGGIEMDDNTRKELIGAWQRRKQEEIMHPFLQEAVPIGLIPYTQSLLLARHLRGGLEAYPAFFWR